MKPRKELAVVTARDVVDVRVEARDVVVVKVEATTLPPAERGKNGFTKVGPSVESEPYDLFHLDEGVFES